MIPYRRGILSLLLLRSRTRVLGSRVQQNSSIPPEKVQTRFQSPEIAAGLGVIQGRDQAPPGRGGQRRGRLPYLRYFQWKAVPLNRLVEFVQKALRFGASTAENDRYRLIDPGHILGLRQSAAQAL